MVRRRSLESMVVIKGLPSMILKEDLVKSITGIEPSRFLYGAPAYEIKEEDFDKVHAAMSMLRKRYEGPGSENNPLAAYYAPCFRWFDAAAESGEMSDLKKAVNLYCILFAWEKNPYGVSVVSRS